VRRMVFVFAVALTPALATAGWIRTYGGVGAGHCVRQTSDGGYIVSGWIGENLDTSALCLMKTDTLGDTLWVGRYYFSKGGVGHCVQQTTDGGYILVSSTYAYDGAGDLLLIKTDEEGDTVWTKVYGSWWEDVGRWVEQTTDGGYILTGVIQPTGSGKHMWLLRTDKDGDTIWTRNYKPLGDRNWFGNCVQPTLDGGYIVSGSAVLMKTDSQGDSIWTSPYGSAGVRQTSDGGYIMATSHYKDVWIIKTNPEGDTVWTRTYGGDDEEYSYDVQQTTDGGYIIVGETHSFATGRGSNVWLLKTDANGDTLWTRVLEPGIGRSVQQTTDGGYIISGSFGGGFLGLIKTDSLGYVGVEEPPSTPTLSNWEVVSAIGHEVVLRYHDKPGGFHAKIYDISGKKVAECHSNLTSGTLEWGEGISPGVYFIREESETSPSVQKVILIE